jgi:hypothetical protein
MSLTPKTISIPQVNNSGNGFNDVHISGSNNVLQTNDAGILVGKTTLPSNIPDDFVVFSYSNTFFGDDSLQFNHLSKSLQHGSSSLASGLYSHASGLNTVSSGAYSNAFGNKTYAYGDYQTVVGQFNTISPKNTSSLFIVGGGIDDSNRADVLLVDRTGITVNGNVSLTGELIVPTIQLPYSSSTNLLVRLQKTGSAYFQVSGSVNLLYIYNGTRWVSSSLA